MMHGLVEILEQIRQNLSSHRKGFDLVAGVFPTVKAIQAAVTLGTGCSLGPEGPSVRHRQIMCPWILLMMANNRERMNTLVAAGAAAGISSEILHTGKSASAPGIWLLTQLAAAKVVATALCKGSLLVGGLYAPSLMIGAAVGAVFGGSAAELINSAIPGNAAVAQPQAYALVNTCLVFYCLHPGDKGAAFCTITSIPENKLARPLNLPTDFGG
ncbi:hypothetical protein NC652_004739 [Populus alba x Populus x berolinensis]|nr:hypothetical protein NC652_004739 [Populus alba x Populus x berolinensis]